MHAPVVAPTAQTTFTMQAGNAYFDPVTNRMVFPTGSTFTVGAGAPMGTAAPTLSSAPLPQLPKPLSSGSMADYGQRVAALCDVAKKMDELDPTHATAQLAQEIEKEIKKGFSDIERLPTSAQYLHAAKVHVGDNGVYPILEKHKKALASSLPAPSVPTASSASVSSSSASSASVPSSTSQPRLPAPSTLPPISTFMSGLFSTPPSVPPTSSSLQVVPMASSSASTASKKAEEPNDGTPIKFFMAFAHAKGLGKDNFGSQEALIDIGGGSYYASVCWAHAMNTVLEALTGLSNNPMEFFDFLHLYVTHHMPDFSFIFDNKSDHNGNYYYEFLANDDLCTIMRSLLDLGVRNNTFRDHDADRVYMALGCPADGEYVWMQQVTDGNNNAFMMRRADVDRYRESLVIYCAANHYYVCQL